MISSGAFSSRASRSASRARWSARSWASSRRARRSRPSAGTVSSVYLPAARIQGAGVRAARSRSRRRSACSRRWRATLLPAREATRVEPSPAMRPGSIEGVVAASCGAAGRARRGFCSRPPAASRVAPRSTDSRSSASPPSRCVVAALACVAPLLVRLARGGPATGRRRTPRRRGPPRRGLLRGRARAQRHRGHRARHGARHDARHDRDGRLDPRDRAGLGRVDAALGPLDQGGRRRPLRASWATCRPRSSRSSAASTASRPSTRSARATPSTRRAGRSRSASGDFRVVARVGGAAAPRTARDPRRVALAARERGRGARLRALRAALRRVARRDGLGRDADGPEGASASPASTATTRTTGAPSSWTASSTSRSSTTPA